MGGRGCRGAGIDRHWVGYARYSGVNWNGVANASKENGLSNIAMRLGRCHELLELVLLDHEFLRGLPRSRCLHPRSA